LGTTDYVFTVTRGGDLSGVSSVLVYFHQGDTNSNDFGGDLPDPEVLIFHPDDSEQTVTYKVSGDRAVEADETFTVSLDDVNGATIDQSASSADGIITNDDEEPSSEAPALYIGSNAPDNVIGTFGDDLILTLDGADNILGNPGNDIIDGGQGNDLIDGGDGDDTIDGGGGDDLINGGADNDTIEGGARNDVISGGSGDDKLGGGSGDDLLSGAKGNDILGGGSGNDLLNGGADDDTLSGGSDDDRLNGGSGNDDLVGGSGNDTFVVESGPGKDNGPGKDSVFDFAQGEDTLEFKGFGSALNAFSDLDTNANDVLDDGDDHVSVVDSGTVIDIGGQTDGASEGNLTVLGVDGLQNDDLSFS